MVGYNALYAQESEVVPVPDVPRVLLKTSVGAFAEYATCLHLSLELRTSKQFAFQPEIGYYSDFLRNPFYNINTSSFNGWRLGGEARVYIAPDGMRKVQIFWAFSCITNTSQVRELARALTLKNGIFDLTETPISYQHQRIFYDTAIGIQALLGKNRRLLLETSFGFGLVSRRVTNLKISDNTSILFNEFSSPQIIFPRNTLWLPSSYLDSGTYLNLAANIKIGYRLY